MVELRSKTWEQEGGVENHTMFHFPRSYQYQKSPKYKNINLIFGNL